MPEPYPKIQPYDHGQLDVGDGNLLYWETCGNPEGKAAVVLHGGPGSGCRKGMRRAFDPTAYRVVLFDQRNAGRSTPHASEPETSLAANTTPHLIADIEALREHLEINRWLVFGGSWGSTLGLAYAEAHPDRVTELVLFSVTTSRPRDIHWLYHEAGRLFPEAWWRFRNGVPEAERDGNLVEAYFRLLCDPDPAVREKAARDWCDWEIAVVSVDPDHEPQPRYDDPRFRMAFARIVTHYFAHDAWLEDGVLLRNAPSLVGIRCVLIHGQLDLGTPVASAWELARVLPDSELVVVHEAGHETRTPGMLESTIAATDKFAAQR